MLILLVGTALFAWLTRGEIARSSDQDSAVSVRALLLILPLVVAACVVRLYHSTAGTPGGEAFYFLNRQQMLAAGLTPYRQFEFMYGPLLLYPNLWVVRVLHISALHAYNAVWMAHWVLGTGMIWFVVRSLDLPIPSRNLFFGLLVLVQLVWTDYGGLNYTPLRAYNAAFWIAVFHRIWKRSGDGWLSAVTAIAAVAFAIACSVEQGVGVAFGVMAYVLILAGARKFSWPAAGVALLGTAVCFGIAAAFGLLKGILAFGSGGYSNPLLPSIPICAALLTYVAAACWLYRALRLRRFDSAGVPLTLAGIALLPAALGRCDLVHITAATPAFVVGLASLYGMPALQSWSAAFVLAGLVVVPAAVRRSDQFWNHVPGYARLAELLQHGDSENPGDNQISPVAVTAASLPCDRRYFAPSFMPLPVSPINPSCLDTGYYLAMVNVASPATVQDKVNELRQRPDEPLILENVSLERQFPTQMSDTRMLYRESGSLWAPKRRNPPVTFAPVTDYIRANYVPGPEIADGKLRVWYPSHPRRT
jgi:hypothetical protein